MKRKFEALPPVTYEAELEKRKIQLEKIIKSKQNTINEKSQLKKAGKIRIVPHKNTMQFYLITKKNDTTGKYLPRNQDDFARQLIQYDYDEKILRSAKRELAAIKKLLVHNKKSGNDFFNSPEFFTANGEKVRSKSEVIIADTLSRMKIPYKYEMSLELKDGKTIYPDFCCLNLRTRQEVYWEHFGLMDDPDYISKAISKIKKIQESGYNLGENFIFTMEKSELPLNPKFVQTMVEKYLA
ncbi:MAG: hypothetical protein MJ176_01450 [Treponema sp.]|nr:hypothetical protein [Treponema sp.]